MPSLCYCHLLGDSILSIYPLILREALWIKVLVGHPDYEITGGSIQFKGSDLLEMEPEERSLAGLFMSFQSPVEIPGVSNIDFLNMAYNARRRQLGLAELGPIEVCFFHSKNHVHALSTLGQIYAYLRNQNSHISLCIY